jgi:4-hydroxybenzoate polyprenyltransferase
MRRTAWVWFAGFAVWLGDGIISLLLHSPRHALLAFLVAAMFFAAGMMYNRQER